MAALPCTRCNFRQLGWRSCFPRPSTGNMGMQNLEELRWLLWMSGSHPGSLEKPFLAGTLWPGCHSRQVKVVSSLIQRVFLCSRQSFTRHQPLNSSMPLFSGEGAEQGAYLPITDKPWSCRNTVITKYEKVTTVISSLEALHLTLHNYCGPQFSGQ